MIKQRQRDRGQRDDELHVCGQQGGDLRAEGRKNLGNQAARGQQKLAGQRSAGHHEGREGVKGGQQRGKTTERQRSAGGDLRVEGREELDDKEAPEQQRPAQR